ncbi:MAG: DUF4013 domain-containing protein [Archaeoglobaceae archaeon]
MGYSRMFEDSFEYVKEALWGKWVKWLLLIVCVIIFPLFFGYVMEILRGKKPAPELENWGRLFIDGLKFFVVMIIYSIPIFAILGIFVGVTFLLNPSTILSGIILAAFLAFIVAFLVLIIASIALVRLSRLERFKEAFNFKAILEQIRRIGWLNYVFGLLLVYVVLGVINFIVNQIPFVGRILNFVLNPAYGIFFARYITLLYDSGEQETVSMT